MYGSAVQLCRCQPTRCWRTCAGVRPCLPAILVTFSSASLIYALIAAGEDGWLTLLTGVLILVAALGYAAFAWWQRRTRTPL